MDKEIEEFYKQYSARVMELDDTPLFATGTFGTFKILSIEEYDDLTHRLTITEKALELACDYLVSTGGDELFELVKDIYNDELYLETKINYFKIKAEEMLDESNND